MNSSTETSTATQSPVEPVYFLGRDEAEARRLVWQSRLYQASTRWMLERAGLRPGMSVLDLGSGAGDVALLARDLVGPRGSVLGVDENPEILELAGARAETAGYENVTFVPGDIASIDLGRKFDAVVGRLVLMYVGDPVRAARNAVRHLVPGGVIALQELNLTMDSLFTEPRVPLWYQAWEWINSVAQRTHIETRMGFRARTVLQEAGLPDPTIQLTASIGSGPGDAIYDYAAETIRSLLPMIIETGVATAAEVDIDTLGERLRQATLASDAIVKYPDLVAVWSRTHD